MFVLHRRGTALCSGSESIAKPFVLCQLVERSKICWVKKKKKDGLRDYHHGNYDLAAGSRSNPETSFDSENRGTIWKNWN